MVKINIQIQKKDLFLITAIAIFLIGANIVIAYNSNPANPSIMGHSLNEIELPNCISGQALSRQANGSWGCGSSVSIKTICTNEVGTNVFTNWTSDILPSGVTYDRVVDTFCLEKNTNWQGPSGWNNATDWAKLTNHPGSAGNQFDLNRTSIRCWAGTYPLATIKACVSYIL